MRTSRPRAFQAVTVFCETRRRPENFENWTTAEATRKKEICLALMRQHQLDVVRGKYLAVTDVQRHWSHIVIAVRGAMMALPTNARMRLQLTAEQTLGLEKLIREALIAVSMTEPPKGRDTPMSGDFEDWWWLENGALFAHIFETMTDLMSGDDESVPAATLYEVQLMIDTLLRRCPEMEFSELAEFRHTLKAALAGQSGHCGHAA